jgi:hypothetical protein
MPSFNVNTNALVAHAARLERINKSALPVAVRQTLNKAAYDVKTNTMLRTSERFVHRKKTFFQANSRVEQAKGFEVNAMKATVGFAPKPGDKSHSVEDLQQQEHGGEIRNRSLIALAPARLSGKWERMVRNEAFMNRILGHIVDSDDMEGNSKQERYTKAAVKAGLGGFVLGNKVTTKGNRIVFLIQGINRFGDRNAILAMPLFAVKKDRLVRPAATHFMQDASLQSAVKMEEYFKSFALAAINKAR